MQVPYPRAYLCTVMTRFQTILFLAVATLTIIVLGQAFWALIVTVLVTAGSALTDIVRSVPTWAWWVLFGLAMSRCGGCRRRRACGT